MDRRSGGVSGGKGLFWFVHILIWWVDVMGTWLCLHETLLVFVDIRDTLL